MSLQSNLNQQNLVRWTDYIICSKTFSHFECLWKCGLHNPAYPRLNDSQSEAHALICYTLQSVVQQQSWGANVVQTAVNIVDKSNRQKVTNSKLCAGVQTGWGPVNLSDSWRLLLSVDFCHVHHGCCSIRLQISFLSGLLPRLRRVWLHPAWSSGKWISFLLYLFYSF